jgi:hypothetical protein
LTGAGATRVEVDPTVLLVPRAATSELELELELQLGLKSFATSYFQIYKKGI